MSNKSYDECALVWLAIWLLNLLWSKSLLHMSLFPIVACKYIEYFRYCEISWSFNSWLYSHSPSDPWLWSVSLYWRNIWLDDEPLTFSDATAGIIFPLMAFPFARQLLIYSINTTGIIQFGQLQVAAISFPLKTRDICSYFYIGEVSI